MKNIYELSGTLKIAAVALLLCGAFFFSAQGSDAAIDGVSGTTFNLTAKAGYIVTPDGNSIFMWGYALNNARMQYPGPTMLLNQGDTITVNLTNTLPVPVSIVFPGQSGLSATGGAQGLLTREAAGGATVTYTFTASQPGTYAYYSGTMPDLQVEMGLSGAIIVRPNTDPATQAYNHADSQFDHEYLFLLSEIDPVIHKAVEAGNIVKADTTAFWPVYWFINGRAAPDTMVAANVTWLPSQPYNCMPTMHPGERTLIRMIGGGRDPHPLHTHGNHHRVIAHNGRLLEGAAGAGADLAEMKYTTSVTPGETFDAIFTWTGERLGWDMYGHALTDPLEPGEYALDHGKPFPVTLPHDQDLTFGGWWSGSPFLGAYGSLPPGQGGLNPNSGYVFMWHSHAEKEIVNNDLFPGGLLTMMYVEHPAVMLMNP